MLDHITKFFKQMYDWVLSWGKSPFATLALFILAFIESSFFPIPPDVLLLALCVSVPSRSFWYALICSIGSVLGGIFGYYIGYALYETVGAVIISSLGLQSAFAYVGGLFQQNAFWSIFAAAFTPIPYKVFTIAAGVWKIPLLTLIVASALGRPLRFFLVAGILYFFGPKTKEFIDKYFNLLTLLFFILLVGGFLVVKYLV